MSSTRADSTRPGPSAPEIGRRHEDAACEYLRARGLVPLERNYRCRLGEIDLVMKDGDAIVFVEVRYRRGFRFGDAAQSIVASKRRRVIMTAQHYLQTHARLRTHAARFDVVAIASGPSGPVMDWIKDAFQTC
jgi:putative endonuclease